MNHDNMKYGMVHQHQRCMYVVRQIKRDRPALETLDFHLREYDLFSAKGAVGSTAYAS